jgi:hypothetical protein
MQPTGSNHDVHSGCGRAKANQKEQRPLTSPHLTFTLRIRRSAQGRANHQYRRAAISRSQAAQQAEPTGTFQDETSTDGIPFAVVTHENKSQGGSARNRVGWVERQNRTHVRLRRETHRHALGSMSFAQGSPRRSAPR